MVEPNVTIGDFLDLDIKDGFDWVIGNPPYGRVGDDPLRGFLHMRYEMKRLLILILALHFPPVAHAHEAALPQPAIALGWSVGVGFGSGHFYSERPGLGALFLL